jgi:hypothetical protein
MMLALQQAIYEKLSQDASVDSLLARYHLPGDGFQAYPAIYDRVPQPADTGDNDLFPMITIGEDTASDWSTDTAVGGEITAVVHVWSRRTGWAQAKSIEAAVRAVLNRSELELQGHEFIGMDWETSTPIRDSDGITLHIAIQFRALVDEEGYGE